MGLYVMIVWAAGFEPKCPRNERAIRNKPTLVKECVVFSALRIPSDRAVAFGLEKSARGPYGVRNLLISKSKFRLHIVCNPGGQGLLPWSRSG